MKIKYGEKVTRIRIGQVLNSGSWGSVTPDTLEKGLGGRETALIGLAKAWAKKGVEVVNFVNTDKGSRYYEGNGYHEYLPIEIAGGLLINQPWDAVVTWEFPSIFNSEKVRENSGVKICEMQVAHFPENEQTPAEEHCDYVAALSDWHKQFLEYSGLEMKKGSVVSLPNGIDIDRYPKHLVEQKIRNYDSAIKDPVFIYSSSPDRGLWNILLAWPKIRKYFPGAEIFITYGMTDYINRMKWAHTRNAQMCLEIEDLVKQDGVTNLGKIGQKELAELQINADAWIYPSDPVWPTETGCISAIENAAAGNPMIISDSDCLPSEFGHISKVSDLPFDADDFVEKIQSLLCDPAAYQQAAIKGREFAETRTWDLIGEQWLDLIERTQS